MRQEKMTAITYQNTQTAIPGWVNTVHQDQPRGYAYELDERFFHIYGSSQGLWTLSTGLTASELKANKSLASWIKDVFGAVNVESMCHAPGEVIAGVWRPGLFSKEQIHQALTTDDYLQRTAEQALRILIEKLDEILLYIEPTVCGLTSYGHKNRELLILACTEVENLWAQYMRLANTEAVGRSFTTRDYVRLLEPLYLAEYAIRFKLVRDLPALTPFAQWNRSNPTQSLSWYEAYNKTKHDRESHFSEATLSNCLNAIAAVIVMFCVRHSPYPLLSGNTSLSGLFLQYFDVELANPDPKSFYVPKFRITSSDNIRPDLCCGNMAKHIEPWQQKPLVLG